MLKRKALMESISSNLHNFLKKIGNNLSVPAKKFLRDSLVGLLQTDVTLITISRTSPTSPSDAQKAPFPRVVKCQNFSKSHLFEELESILISR